MQQTALWFIGKNEDNACGMESNGKDSVFQGYRAKTLTISKWNKKLQNIINITTQTQNDEFVVFGFIRQCQKLLPDVINTFYTIPTSIIFVCLRFFGNNYNKYWGAGMNNYGQCCISHCDDIKNITEINGISNIEKICSGDYGYNVFWITSNGEIYGNGANDRCQLGITKGRKGEKIKYHNPILLNFFIQHGLQCVDATSSENFNIIICDDGSVWSAGYADYGQNGHGEMMIQNEKFVKIDALKQYKIIKVSTSDVVTLFLGKNGNVWSCGDNTNGTLGLGHSNTDSTRLPTKIEYFSQNNIKIIQIKCGSTHCVALDKNGKIYCFGRNHYGQCAQGTLSVHLLQLHTPTLVDSLLTKTVTNIKCSRFHTGAVTNNDECYLWGANDYNQCCLINDKIDRIFIPHCINQYVLETTNSKHIIDIYLLYDTTMVLLKNSNDENSSCF